MGNELEPVHYSVLYREILAFFLSVFDKDRELLFLDGTAGEGGHSLLLLEQFPNSKLVLVDRDSIMLSRAQARLSAYSSRVIPIEANFSDLDSEFLNSFGVSNPPDGILLDLGISTFHLLHAGRGFSFRENEPLDMRLSSSGGISAEDVINTYPEKALSKIFYEYGEERWTKKIVEAILERRRHSRIGYSGDLAQLVSRVIPRKFWPPGRHPATRVFQALRIEVNQELLHIEVGVKKLLDLLAKGGLLQVISFHSLEDRIVKNLFRDYARGGEAKLLTKKPALPSDAETKENPASRSAKLRVIHKSLPTDTEDEEEEDEE
ncbi:16S rRNA (cytosine(1402)-N(4))-methyltransferase [Leptospira hartskeerlii]|uniref:Ribosomal RNA small subunit methyltransferase H n=1 Tax=Leptospira hartskeerlii TaxID=2023177 RepID=A0A2M9XG47_9LEPT|nr:16S rRNA (cytosine(1402)-N(4))-methyltransferase RsmH [Leptospira hartskeerlii]PJZ26619.1 16S rRNA (cytosine(1402)-N(4))-methyltransferase [Leptospira hartskeerlii]PJZ34898.1 16S rRNA (cytosine(1402)-N(4))-methyltransferase [Leptospira hartskeerlii]